MAYVVAEEPLNSHQQIIPLGNELLMDFRYPLQAAENGSNLVLEQTLTFNEKVKSHLEYKVAEKIWQIGPPILFLCGTLGNVLTFLIMCKWSRGRRSNNMQIYMVFLAVSDLLVLYSGLLRNWITWTFGFDIRSLNVVVCKGHTFLLYLSIYVSTWLLVMMTLERTCSACMPTRVNSLCTRRRAFIIIFVIVLFQFGLHLHFLIRMTITRSDNQAAGLEDEGDFKVTTNRNVLGEVTNNIERTTVLMPLSSPNVSDFSYICDAGTEGYRHYVHHIWPMIDFFLLSIIPSILVFIGNFIIVMKARKSLGTAEELNVTSNSRARRKRFSTMTWMLVLISIFFILTTLPTCVYNLWERTHAAKVMLGTAEGVAKSECIWALVNLAMYCNNTFNFFLYLLSGRKFRKDVRRQFSGKPTESQSNVISGYSFQLTTRFNPPQETRNGHTHGLNNRGGSIHRTFQLNNHTGKQSSVKYKPCNVSNESNAYL